MVLRAQEVQAAVLVIPFISAPQHPPEPNETLARLGNQASSRFS